MYLKGKEEQVSTLLVSYNMVMKYAIKQRDESCC